MTATTETPAPLFLDPLVVDWRRCVDCGEVFRSARPWCVECLTGYVPDWPWLQPEWQASPDELRRRLLAAKGQTRGERAGTWLLANANGGHWMAAASLRPFVQPYGGPWTIDFPDIADIDCENGQEGLRGRRTWLDEPIEARWTLSIAYTLAVPDHPGTYPVDRIVNLVEGPDRALVDLAVAHAAGRARLDRAVA